MNRRCQVSGMHLTRLGPSKNRTNNPWTNSGTKNTQMVCRFETFLFCFKTDRKFSSFKPVLIQLHCQLTGAIAEKIQTGVDLKIYLSEKAPWNFQICHFILKNSRENTLSPMENLQNCVTPLGNSKFKTKIHPWKFHMNFFLTLLEIPLIF